MLQGHVSRFDAEEWSVTTQRNWGETWQIAHDEGIELL